MSTKTIITLALGLGLSLAACNGSVTTDPTGSGGNGGNAATTGVSSTGASMTSASTGSSGLCAGFDDATSAGAVTVRFHNDTGSPLYLPAQCDSIDYTITPLGDTDGTNYTFETTCLQTCAELQKEPPFACGACAPRSYLVAPGATRVITWNATGLKPDIAMPASCFAQPQSYPCAKIVNAPPAPYNVQATGFSSCGADCTCDSDGVCSGGTEGQQAFADPAKFSFPEDNAVDVVFGFCAFGCPDGD
jgi:hypothetical protein